MKRFGQMIRLKPEGSEQLSGKTIDVANRIEKRGGVLGKYERNFSLELKESIAGLAYMISNFTYYLKRYEDQISLPIMGPNIIYAAPRQCSRLERRCCKIRAFQKN